MTPCQKKKKNQLGQDVTYVLQRTLMRNIKRFQKRTPIAATVSVGVRRTCERRMRRSTAFAEKTSAHATRLGPPPVCQECIPQNDGENGGLRYLQTFDRQTVSRPPFETKSGHLRHAFILTVKKLQIELLWDFPAISRDYVMQCEEKGKRRFKPPGLTPHPKQN